MSVSKNQEQARRIIEFFQAKNEDRKLTMNHFLDEGVSRRTINKVLQRYTNEGRVDYKKKLVVHQQSTLKLIRIV